MTHVIGNDTTVTDYCDNAIYENGTLDKLMTEYGYVTLSDTAYHYFVQDHQGNNRAVVNQDGTVEEVNHYYPFGGVFASTASIQPFKYNGKELDRNGGLDWYDYGARMYDPILGRFVTTDPLAESSYFVNPYAYCLNNPFNRVDPSGMASHYNWETGHYEDERGKEVSWESVQQEYGIAKSEGQSNDNPPSRDDVDGVTGAARRVNSANALPIAIPLWSLVGETISSVTMSYFGAFFVIITLQGDTDGQVYVKEATDSGKNEKHGDGGRTLSKDEKRIGELESQLNNAKNNKERNEIKNKIRRIKENGQKRNKGEEHSRGNKR